MKIAEDNGAGTAVVETRYIDLDYRSEYSYFYSKAFKSFPDSAHRIHFFKARFEAEGVWNLPDHPGYLGYMVVRPSVKGVVGRTVLTPPHDLEFDVRVMVSDPVHFFGQPLIARGFPFMQQDALCGSCAQAAAWMAHYAMHLGDAKVERRPVAAFSESVNQSLAPGRILPTSGLSIEQLSDLLNRFGLPPVYYKIDELDGRDRPAEWPIRPAVDPKEAAAKRTSARYLNGAMPLLAIVHQWMDGAQTSEQHAVVACGYRRPEDGRADIELIVNDDRRGPYLVVPSLLSGLDEETHEKWEWKQLLVPMPEKLWLTGEAAERAGCSLILGAAATASSAGKKGGSQLIQRHKEGELTVRSYPIASWRYKKRLRSRCSDPLVLRELSEARLPRFIWVVEAVDRVLRDNAQAAGSGLRHSECVLAEAVFDATSDHRQPELLALRLPGLLSIPKPNAPNWNAVCSSSPLSSGGQFDA